MDEDEIFQDCESSDTISPLKELKEWIESYGKFPENIRKLKKKINNLIKPLVKLYLLFHS